MMVSLASVPRLRKLRRTEAEDVVDAKEYSKRLRRQFESLNGVPEWATFALQHPSGQGARNTDDAGSDDDEMDIDDEVPNVAPLSSLLRSSSSLVRRSNVVTGPGGKKRKIRPEVLDIQRVKDVEGVQPSSITSLNFHPQLPLLLSSGPSSTLYLHHVTPSPPAPSPNPLLTSLHVSGTQLTTTAFHPTDSRIFLSARRRYFHVWDLASGHVEKVTRVYGHQHEQRTMERFKLSPCGRYVAFLGSAKKGGGVINILSATTLQWQAQARIESGSGIAEFAWWCNGQGLAIVGKNGEVSEWSVADQTVIARWQDEGAVGTTTLALGGRHGHAKSPIGPDRWIAVGSSSGIVNIYDRQAWLSSSVDSTKTSLQQPIPTNPKPSKVLDHLTHPISHLAFSSDGQVMAMASFWKKDHMRLVHLPSCTVYRNWPTSATPLGRITGVAFAGGDILEEATKGGSGDSLHSLLAVANEQGKIRLFEI
ncbi:WD40 repeat-like protein, partial [Polychaeton citri CBS 116435]